MTVPSRVITGTAGITTWVEDGKEVFPCRCGTTHRGDYGFYDYMHHNCFHTSDLIDLSYPHMKLRTYLMCPDCGMVFNVRGNSQLSEWRRARGPYWLFFRLVKRPVLYRVGALVCRATAHTWQDDAARNNPLTEVAMDRRWFTCSRCGIRCRGFELGYKDSEPPA